MKLISRSPKETLKIGKGIAKKLQAGDIICLFGNLGAGKTVLVKGIAQGLGIAEKKISSPTFVLAREYKLNTGLPLYHLDLYRLKHTKDILELGYEELLFSQGIAVIEWADRLERLLPEEFLKIKLSFKSKTQRALEITAFGARYKKLIRQI